MNQPTTLTGLAEKINFKSFNGVTPLSTLIEDGTDPKDFFKLIEPEFLKAKAFARYIPIVQEVVSTKKHEYKLKTHIVFFLNDGTPYIFTPKPTITHKRAGRSLKADEESSHLMIPHNCNRYLVLAVRDGCNVHPKTGEKEPFVDMAVTEYTL